MLGKTYDAEVCSIARALEVIGERWSLLIVRDAVFRHTTRFNDFQGDLGIATNVLTTRLNALVGSGVMRRQRYSEQPEVHEYVLTDMGRALAPALVALTEWGDRWVTDGEPPILYRHSGCGGHVAQQTVCSQCGPVDDPGAIEAALGPGMPPDRPPISSLTGAPPDPGR